MLCSGVLIASLAIAAPSFGQDGGPPPAAASDGGATTAGDPGPPQAPAPQAAPQEPAKEDGFQIGGFTFKIGGRVKLDFIHDFQFVGNEDAFDTRTIVIDGTERVNTNLHAKETRLSLDIRGDVDGEELRMYVEGDFYGSSATFRLRQAYGKYGNLLAGQTWSTFVDEDNLPRTIDFESPTAFASIRQALVRWTQDFGWVTWAAAVEDNKSNIIVPANIAGIPEYPLPDFVTRFRWDMSAGHIQTAGFLGVARFRPDVGERDTATLWGAMVSANFSTWDRDTIYGVVTFGDGIGRYRGGTTAVPDFNGRLHPVRAVAFMGGYEHFWAERWSTNAVYSTGEAPEEPFYTSDVHRSLTYGAVNLLYWFLGDRGWTGVEYLYGRREVFGPGPNSGTAHRVQYAVRFNFP